MQILRIKEDAQDIPIMLVGNKVDLEEERVVSKEEGEEMAKRCKSGFIEGACLFVWAMAARVHVADDGVRAASAKNNINVNEAFFELVRLVNKWREAHPVNGGKAQAKKGCVVL